MSTAMPTPLQPTSPTNAGTPTNANANAPVDSQGNGRPIQSGSARAWLLAIRPATLTAAAAPVLVGTAVAHLRGGVRPGAALAALAGALLIQMGTNLANDLFDYEKGADGPSRTGPVRTAASGLLSTAGLRRGMVIMFSLAVAVGVYLVHVGGWPIVAIGLGSIAAGVAYTGGPYPLGYHGLGDLFVFLFFGFVAVCGTVFVQVDSVPILALVASVPMGALSSAVLVVNNVRDEPTDQRAGKRTLPARFGRGFGVAQYAAFLACAYASTVAMAGMLRSGWPLLGCVTLPWAFSLFARLRCGVGSELNAVLRATAKLVFAMAVTLSIGLVLAP